jgi:hypothetical protein
MHIYLAARYSRHNEMKVNAIALEGYGHTVTSRWIQGQHQLDGERHDEAATFAIEDMEDLTKSDCVVSFTETGESSKRPSKGGRHVEFGAGLALNKRMIVIGPRENVFHYLPNIEIYESLEEFLDVLSKEVE